MTALNSLQLSLSEKFTELGIKSAGITISNIDEILSSDATVYLIGPEVLTTPQVIRALLKDRKSFVVKCVDEAHLCKQYQNINNEQPNTFSFRCVVGHREGWEEGLQTCNVARKW